MMQFLSKLLGPDGFMPHGHCYFWDPALVSLHVISDSLIALAYFSIPITLLHFLRKKRDVPFNWIFLAFGTFIMACGTTHVMEIWNVWNTSYWLAGLIKAITATASVSTALALVWIVPQALALRTPEDLERINRLLEKEITERKLAEQEVRSLNAQLEQRVHERTSELTISNEALRQEIVVRMQAEEALASERNLLRTLIDNLPDCVYTKDTKGRFVLSNRATRELLQASTEGDLAGKSVFDLFSEELARPQEKDDQQVLSSGQATRDREEEFVDGSGKTRCHLTTKLPLIDRTGATVGLIGVSRDITERKHAEQALRASEERFRLLVEGVKDYAIIMLDPAGRVSSWNPGAERIKGYRADEIIGRHFSLFYPPEDIESGRPLRELEMVTARGRLEDESWRVRKDGSRFWASVVITKLNDEAGRLLGFAKIACDITERKRAEERFRVAVEAAPNAMIMIDQEGSIVLVNSQTEALFGYSRNELMGESVELLVPDRYRARHSGHRQGFFVEPQVRPMGAGRDLFGRHKDGREVPVEIGLNPMVTEEGSYVLASIIDITERKRAMEALEQTTAELERSNAELEQFAYVASHDLQEPLRAVAGTVQLLQQRYQDKLDARADEFIFHAVDGAARMQTLINDLLIYSRLGTRGNPFKPTDLSEILRIVQANLSVAIKEKGAVISSDPLPSVRADPTQMVQLLQNLISNAIKFSGDRSPQIQISASRRSNEWLFSVQDNGIGMEPQYFERIFLVFQRLHTRREFPGTGIGLAICKKIVQRHGGRIWVESGADRGSKFYFTIRDRK